VRTDCKRGSRKATSKRKPACCAVIFPSLDTLSKIALALDLPIAQFFAEDSLNGNMNGHHLSDDELRFLTQIRRYSTNLNDSDRKLLLAMVKKFASTAVAR